MLRVGLAAGLFLAASGLLTGCATSPDQALYSAHTAYVAGLTVVTTYGKQPLCPGNTWGAACANGPILIAAKKASDAAAAALNIADPAVDAWKLSKSADAATKAQLAISAARSSVDALQFFVLQIQGH